MIPPHKYQFKGRDFILKNGSAYLMIDCGLGKTRMVLMAIQKLLARYPTMQTIVFAPVYPAIDTWPKEIAKWTPELTYTVLHGASKDHRCSIANSKNIIIIPFSSLKWFYDRCQQGYFKMKKYMVVFDESSMLKAHTSKRVEMLTEMDSIFSAFRVALSGTPAPQGLVDLWSQYFLLDGGKRLTPGFHQFRNRYFNYTGPPSFQTTIKLGSEQHIYKAIDDITLRMAAEDYLELPPLITNDIVLELPANLRKTYDYLEEQFCLEFPDAVVLAASQAAVSNKLRQFLQGAVYGEVFDDEPSRIVKQLHTIKVQMLKQLLDQSSKQPVLCAIQFQFEYDIICKVLKYKPPIIYGKTPTAHAQSYMRRWNRKQIPLLIVHPASVGHGVNIQTGGNILIWLALPWSLELYLQLIKRLVRQGQTADRVVMHRILFTGTKDMDVALALNRKNCTQQDLYNALTKRRKKKT